MAVNPMNNKNLSRTHSKELAKNNRGKRTRKNSDYKTTATAARQAQSQAPQKAAWPTKVKVTLVSCSAFWWQPDPAAGGSVAAGQPAAEQPDHSAAGHLLRRAVFYPQGLSRTQGLQAGRRGQRRTYRFRPVLRRYGRVGPDPDGRLSVPPCPAFVPGISR